MNEEKITSRELISFFESEITKHERKSLGENTGNRPYAPVLTVYLGNEAVKQHPDLERAIFQIWPQFRNEIQFCGIGDDGSYFAPAEDDGKVVTAVTAEEIETKVSAMFGMETHFENHEYLNIYFIMETSSFADVEEYDRWIERINEFRGFLRRIRSQAMLLLLLNEDLRSVHRDVAAQIRNRLSLFCGSAAEEADGVVLPDVGCVFLLSNYRRDSVIMENWTVCSRIMAAVMAVSNSNEIRIGASDENKVFTVGYAREEKPIGEIGKVVTHRVIEALSGMTKGGDLKISEDVISRLGITGRGTLKVLDDYADSIVWPDPELFPRNTNDDIDIYALKSSEFDSLTMGTWSAYLEQIIDDVKRSVSGASTFGTIRRSFREQMEEQFTIGELLELCQHLTEIRERIAPRRAGAEENVSSAALSNLKFRLSSDEGMIDCFLDVLKDLGREARAVRECWDALIVSKNRDFAVRESSLTNFYSSICQNYFNMRDADLRKKVNAVRNLTDQRRLLQNTIRGIIESDKTFELGFEDELKTRMKYVGQELDTREYVKSRLTGNSVKIYLRVPYALGAPRQSMVLMDAQTDLKTELSRTLVDIRSGREVGGIDERYFYYDTGSNSAAETMKIYEVSYNQLMAEQEG